MGNGQNAPHEKILELIQVKLDEIELRENVCILHAIESGSRAWGFASPDSDYDVRFIYMRSVEEYLKLEKTRDVIEWQLDEILDINGWDLQKALRLLRSSNPTLFEWSRSPIVYKTTEAWTNLSRNFDDFFLRRVGLHHYLSAARGNYQKYLLGEVVSLKKYFYVLRPLLACKWILDRGCPPPMLFSELVETELEPSLRSFIDDLLQAKAVTSEVGLAKRNDTLNSYIEETLADLMESVNALPLDHKVDWGQLNGLFLSTIGF